MSTSIEVFSKVTDYRERRITLWELESWLVPRLPFYLENPESAVGRLVGMIELCLAEIQAGIRTERSCRLLLSRHIACKSVVWIRYPDQTSEEVTGSATPITETVPSVWVDLSRAWSTGAQVVTV